VSTRGWGALAGGTAGAVAAGGVACVAYGALIERKWYRLRRQTVPVLPRGSEPLTVLHLSDLHQTAADRRQRDWLARLAERQPVDLLVVTGDMLGEPEALHPVLATLGGFKPRLGAVAVLGSNDYYAPRFKNYFSYFLPRRRRRLARRNPWQDLVDGLRDRGWTVLANERARIGDIELAGLDDGHIGRDDAGILVPASADGAARLRLGICHAPYRRSLDAFERNGYEMVLAGHTHGGQVCLPLAGALVTNCDLPRDQARGLSRHGSTWLHVSGGLGTSKYAPFRFACRPEASVLELVQR
jgi:predicted MPP superfamily phosphohydrolase